MSDQVVVLKGKLSRCSYPDKLRRVSYYDAELGKRFVFVTNNFEIPALSIALLYKSRWLTGIVFQVAQTELAYQVIFWLHGECGAVSDLDSGVRLFVGGNLETETWRGASNVTNLANLKRHAVRENTCIYSS